MTPGGGYKKELFVFGRLVDIGSYLFSSSENYAGFDSSDSTESSELALLLSSISMALI